MKCRFLWYLKKIGPLSILYGKALQNGCLQGFWYEMMKLIFIFQI